MRVMISSLFVAALALAGCSHTSSSAEPSTSPPAAGEDTPTGERVSCSRQHLIDNINDLLDEVFVDDTEEEWVVRNVMSVSGGWSYVDAEPQSGEFGYPIVKAVFECRGEATSPRDVAIYVPQEAPSTGWQLLATSDLAPEDIARALDCEAYRCY